MLFHAIKALMFFNLASTGAQFWHLRRGGCWHRFWPQNPPEMEPKMVPRRSQEMPKKLTKNVRMGRCLMLGIKQILDKYRMLDKCKILYKYRILGKARLGKYTKKWQRGRRGGYGEGEDFECFICPNQHVGDDGASKRIGGMFFLTEFLQTKNTSLVKNLSSTSFIIQQVFDSLLPLYSEKTESISTAFSYQVSFVVECCHRVTSDAPSNDCPSMCFFNVDDRYSASNDT